MFQLPGAWVSFGVHVSIVPSYLDIHILWWIFSVMSKNRGCELQEAEYSNASL